MYLKKIITLVVTLTFTLSLTITNLNYQLLLFLTDENTECTRKLILHHSCNFDLTNIRMLNLSKFDIITLKPDMHQCTNLIDLDLSGNQIGNVEPLQNLDQLVCLNLASNQITNIGWLFLCSFN